MNKVITKVSTVLILFFASLASAPIAQGAYSFSSHTFTPCGATGKSGPTQIACRNAYTTSWDDTDANFTVVSGIQLWVVPATGKYRISAAGAKGANAANGTGGSGALIEGDVTLTAGTTLKVLVGQSGLGSPSINGSGGGGGGSFVTSSTNAPIMIAGGGGSAAWGSAAVAKSGKPGVTTTTGSSSQDGSSGGNSGLGGSGPGYYWGGAGGGGLLSEGGNYRQGSGVPIISGTGGSSFTQGGAGGTAYTARNYGGDGGFGGGGAGGVGASGGGGYSGGGGDWSDSADAETEGAGGGGSWNSGTNQTNTQGANAGAGYITITYIVYSSTISISSAGNSRVVAKGATLAITASVNQDGRVTFFANDKKIAGCISRATTGGSITCYWKAAIRGSSRIYAKLTPTDTSYISSASLSVNIGVATRTTPRV